ncbi:MAG: hypothetical protein WCF24_07200 [Acidimicrobiales bacterium]
MLDETHQATNCTTGVTGTAAGFLNTADGFDLASDGVTPTHTATG